MITSGYELNLYCDCEDCANGFYAWVPEQFIGTSWAGVTRHAKSVGWIIRKDKNTCFAPGHKRISVNDY